MLTLNFVLPLGFLVWACQSSASSLSSTSPYQQTVDRADRQRININNGWRFFRSETILDGISYNSRPGLPSTENTEVLRPWILPSGNHFIKDPDKQHRRPSNEPATIPAFVRHNFIDDDWKTVNLPHDWAIKGPFYTGQNATVSGGMGRLPIQGVGWYRRRVHVPLDDQNKSIYLDIDGAMSYAMVWLNGNLVGGWPYPYNSFRLDLTPFLRFGGQNLLAIRLENPTDSSRWYPGGGLYRNVWLTKVQRVHVPQWGVYITTEEVSSQSALVNAVVKVENTSNSTKEVTVATDIYEANTDATLSWGTGPSVASFKEVTLSIPAGEIQQANSSAKVQGPKLWGPFPLQTPNQYVAITRLYDHGDTASSSHLTDTYETRFGIRSLAYNPDKGLVINGKHVRIQGVNQHHDLGALGAALNVRAAERQLEVLRELGCNAIRTSHNPPAPELLDLTDRMGFLVMDEVFDMWVLKKTVADQHLLFPDWHEPILRAFLQRDRNHPSVVAWSIGNEVGEQTTANGSVIARKLHDIVKEEDPTRPSTASMNAAQPNMTFPGVLDILSLNYQGEGIRDSPAYSNLNGRRTKPLYADFHSTFPEKLLLSSETAATVSTRGTYTFPVTDGISAPVNDTSGGNSTSFHVSAYELYTADFGSSPDKVFSTQDRNPFVAGEFVWSGWDYLGEPTPYYSARSSYFGIIDLAGFKKDRFYLYQSRWRPDLKMAHILPHWTWPDRLNITTPVHVFSAADEAELFLNARSQGRKTKNLSTYRFRWDDVVYQPGELRVVTYKNGSYWAEDSVRTSGAAARLEIAADRTSIKPDGRDLAFITIRVVDSEGNLVPEATNEVNFSVTGPGEIVATDNGDPTDFTSFESKDRKVFNGLALAIVRVTQVHSRPIIMIASGYGVKSAQVV
ncbi:glycoside hydrolase family 2 sugar binding protein [Cadophora sp. MPI-SDFR-AT-0126]|nr:glycoside hydrolase family 2 sugar binding protein [Leotiomycetes sp. MPI-SDFR-AT-0126]